MHAATRTDARLVLIRLSDRTISAPASETVAAAAMAAAAAAGLPPNLGLLTLTAGGRRLDGSATLADAIRARPYTTIRATLPLHGGVSISSEKLFKAFKAFGINQTDEMEREQFVKLLMRPGKGCVLLDKQRASALFDRFRTATASTVNVANFVGACSAKLAWDTEICRRRWEANGGGEVEEALNSGAVALLDAEWMVRESARGGVLQPRQRLPPEAFVALDELRATTSSSMLPIVAVSHCWLAKDHADPRGHNFSTLRRVLSMMLEHRYLGKPCFPRLGVFIDFCSIHQRCRGQDGQPQRKLIPPAEGEAEPPVDAIFPEEAQLFDRALASLSTFYSHPAIFSLLLTSHFPADYANAQLIGDGGSNAIYMGRGWCFCEAMWSTLVKDPALVLDLGLDTFDEHIGWNDFTEICSRRGTPPMEPWRFEALLKTKRFSVESDAALVARLYREGFEKRFAPATELRYLDLGWADDEVEALASILKSGVVNRLTSLSLVGNQIGDVGARSLADCLVGLPKLRHLDLSFNALGEEGTSAIALGLGRVRGLEILQLTYNNIGDEGAAALATALAGVRKLVELRLDWNEVGDAGVAAIASKLRKTPDLRVLELGWNAFSDAGARALAEVLPELPELGWLATVANTFKEDARAALLSAWGERCGQLKL